MKKVLLVSFFFPPDGGAGTQRAAKFCKYLSQFGWQPIVLTRDGTKSEVVWNPNDASLLGGIAAGIAVHRVATGGAPQSWARRLPSVDIARNWLEPAAAAALDLIRHDRPDAILVTMSPFDLSLLGTFLQDQTGIPLVFDLRDPWALDGVRVYGTKRRWRRDFSVMASTLPRASAVIANTPEAKVALLAAIPNLQKDRVCVIPNGYDAEDFSDPVSICDTPGRPFRLVHTGTFLSGSLYQYDGWLGRLRRLRHYRAERIDPSGRTPLHLLRAVKLLRLQRDPRVEQMRIVFAGRDDAGTLRCVRESGVSDLVEILGYVSHTRSIELVRTADALFLHLHGLSSGRRSLIVPGKTYEYLASGRPILGCLPSGDARDLVERSGRGFCAEPCDHVAIAHAIRCLFDAATADAPALAASRSLADGFDRRTLTGTLAELLDRVSPKDDGRSGNSNA